MTSTTLTLDSALEDWNDWHRRRLAEVTAEHGIASLITTTWLGDHSVEVPGLPGLWSSHRDEAWGSAGAYAWTLTVGTPQRFGAKLATVIAARSRIALRVFDPAAASRTSVADIGRFAWDPAWQLTGRFAAASNGSTRAITHADGARTDDVVAGTVRVEIAGQPVELLALPTPDGRLQVTFADRTNGRSTAQFRFLSLPRPAADGAVPVDFNRAYLPPCAFSDHYLCPLPPAQNRLPFDVDAGETHIERH